MLINIFCRFSGLFIEKTTLEEFEEICEQIHKELRIQYNDVLDLIKSHTQIQLRFSLGFIPNFIFF